MEPKTHEIFEELWYYEADNIIFSPLSLTFEFSPTSPSIHQDMKQKKDLL